MLISLFTIIIVPITLAFLSAIGSLLIALHQNNIYIQEYCDNLFNDKVKFSSSHTQFISYRLSKEIYKFPYFLNIMNSFSDKVVRGKVIYNPTHHKSFLNNILAYVNLEDQALTKLALKNSFLVDAWYIQDEVYMNNLDNQKKIIVQNYTQISPIIRSIGYQSRVYLADQEFEAIPYKAIFQAYGDGFFFSTFSNTTLSNAIDKQNINAIHQYDPRTRFWYQNSLNQTSFYMNQPSLSFGSNVPYLSQFGCQKSLYLNPQTKKIEIHHVQCLDAMLSNLSNYFQNVIQSSKQYYVIDPRTLQIVYNSINEYKFSQIKQIDNFYNIELEFLEDQQQSQYFQNLISNNYKKWIFNTSNNTKTTLIQMMNQSQYQVIFDYKRNQSIYKVIINPIIGFDDIPNHIASYLGIQGQQLEYVYLQINMISDEDLRAQTQQLIQLSTIILIISSICISILGLLLFCAIFQYLRLVKNQVYKPIDKLTQILQRINLLQKQCDINEIIIEFQQNADEIFLSKETRMLYNSFYNLFQQLQYLSEHFFIENEGKTLIDLNKKVKFFQKFNNYYALGIAHNNIGCILLNQKHYFQSMEHFQSSIICAKYEIQEFCDKTENIKFLNILQPYSFSDQNIDNNMTNLQNKMKDQCINISNINHLSLFNIQINQSKLKQPKNNSRIGLIESSIINNFNQKNKSGNGNGIFTNNIFQIEDLNKEDEQYQELQVLISNLIFRKLNYLIALIIQQQDFSNDQQQKFLYSFWEQIKQLTKELIPLQSILPCQEKIKVICECILSKCYYNMNKLKKAYQRIQQSKKIVKNQHEQFQKKIIESNTPKKKITKERISEKTGLKFSSIVNQNTHEFFDSPKKYVNSPKIFNHESNNNILMSQHMILENSQNIFNSKNQPQKKTSILQSKKYKKQDQSNELNHRGKVISSQKNVLSLLNMPTNNLYVYIQFNYAEYLIFTKQYKKAAYILTSILEKSKCLMSNMPYRIIFKLQQIFDLFKIQDKSIKEQQQRFNKNKNIKIVISFEINQPLQNIHKLSLNKQNNYYYEENDNQNFSFDQLQLFIKLIEEALVKKDDSVSISLNDLQTNSVQQYMPLIRTKLFESDSSAEFTGQQNNQEENPKRNSTKYFDSFYFIQQKSQLFPSNEKHKFYSSIDIYEENQQNNFENNPEIITQQDQHIESQQIKTQQNSLIKCNNNPIKNFQSQQDFKFQLNDQENNNENNQIIQDHHRDIINDQEQDQYSNQKNQTFHYFMRQALSQLISKQIGYNEIGYKGASGLGSGLENCINLSNLTLNLYNNKIGDEGASGLCSGLANCINLSNLTLEISSNKIGDKGASDLGSALANCINLSNLTLHLSSNQIGEKGSSDLGSALANCINLSNLTLHLGFNKIGDKGASGLGSGLENCINLSNLRLYLIENQIGEKGASDLGSALANCINLSNLTLDLSYNKIVDEGSSGLGSGLANCINFSNLALDLSYNKIVDKGASGLCSGLANSINLSNLTLCLHKNKIVDKGTSGLCSGLANCINFSNLALCLSKNQIGDKGASSLGSALANCINLSYLTLDLHSNKIGDKGASGLGSGLANCINLSNLTLDLHSNKIGDKGASGLGYGLANCINLSNLTLDLHYNQIDNEDTSGLGSGLANCINLSNLKLRLTQNQFICFG
ncbi:transmembrane protein, putative, partial (macronuclear) [Tetrahymena thermophila SB210]